MALVNFDFPGVTLKQSYAETTAGTVSTLGVACVGRQYKLHSVAVDQSTSQYTPTAGWTGSIGSYAVDTNTDTQHLVVNGAFKYYTDTDINNVKTSLLSRKIVFNSAIQDGSGYTAVTAFGTRGAKVGDPIQIAGSGDVVVNATILKINFVDGVGLAEIIISDCGTATESTTVTSVSFCEEQEVGYDSSYFTLTSTGSLSINPGLSTKLSDLSGVDATLLFGDITIKFRSPANDFVGKLGVLDSMSEVETVLGAPCADNPLALACYFALSASAGNTVYFTGVKEDTTQAYLTALGFLETYSYIYSIVPCTENADIIKACLASCKAASDDEDSKIRRALWYGITEDKEPVLWNVTGSFTSTESALTFTATIPLYIEKVYQAGDVLEAGSNRWNITGVSGASTLALEPITGVTPPTGSVSAKVIRTQPDNYDLIDNIVSKRCTQSERACAVWADGLEFNGEALPNYPLAAAAAGMRSGEPVHRPLSNLSYSIVALSDEHGFTRSQLKQIGSNGIWIIANNEDGTPVNMKQITTAVANNLNLDEESVISNADTIALGLCNIGREMVGCSNITDNLLNLLRLQIYTYMESFKNETTGNPLIGPQILEWELVSLYQDSVNLDHVYANITVTPPKPFNKFNITMLVI